MRVFFAIPLPNHVKAALSMTTQLLRETADTGTFMKPENLLLTVLFVGEVPPDRLDALASALQSVTVPAFPLVFNGLGHSHKRHRDIWWIGTEPCDALQTLYKELCDAAAGLGFTFEVQPYAPHLPLGREIIMPEGFQKKLVAPPPLQIQVDRICLMRSARENGELHAKEISHVMLAPANAQT